MEYCEGELKSVTLLYSVYTMVYTRSAWFIHFIAVLYAAVHNGDVSSLVTNCVSLEICASVLSFEANEQIKIVTI